MLNPRFKSITFDPSPKREEPPITVKKSSAMGPTEVSSFMTKDVRESNKVQKRRAKNKMARKTKRAQRRKK